MSETLCTLRTKGGGGGRYTETSLWTNSAPTSNFADQNVTLSDSITNYKYIAIRIRFSTTESASATTIVSTSDFVTMTNTTTSGHPLCFVGGRYSNVYERAVYYVDATTVKFGSSFQQNSTTVSNGTIVPTEILGLNELATGHRLRETILWTNSAPTSSFSGQTVTLSESLSNYDMVRLYWRKTTSDSSEMYIDVRVSDYTSITANTGSFQLYMGYRHTNGGCGRSVRGSGSTASFGNCYFFASTTAANNANVIPTKVAGLRIS